MRLKIRILAALLLVPSALSAAAPPYLVKDLKTGLAPSDSSPRPSFYGYAALQDRVVFFGLLPGEVSSDNGQPQCWLWSSDGTPGGTTRLLDLCARLEDPDELRFGFQMVASNGTVAFFIDFRSRLWRTDGTGPGTYPLGPTLLYHPLGYPAIGPGGVLFFAGCTPAGGCQPWRSDGTRRGTRRLLDGPNSAPRTFLADGDRMLFTAAGGLWTTDGTRAGTNVLVQVGAETSSVRGLIRRGDKVYFVSYPSLSLANVWAYDLSTRKAVRLRSSPIGDEDQGGAALELAAGRVLIRDDDEDGRSVLWETDGTRGGTRPLGPPFQFGWISPIREAGGRAVFAAMRPSTGPYQPARLWSLAPGAKRSVLLTGCPEGCPEVVVVLVGCSHCQEYYSDLIPSLTLGGRFYFVGKDARHGQELWSTDGTGPGTRLVKDLCPGDCDGAPFQMAAAAGRLLLVDRQGGVWISDGTPGGTVRLGTTRAPGGPDQSTDLAVLGGRIFFTGFDEANGFQPWRSDLTPEGTGPADVIGSSLAASSWPYALTSLGGRVLFQACDNSADGLWVSDGTEAGTVQLPGSDIPCPPGSRYGSLFIPVGDIAFYAWNYKLWATDGTAAGTRDLLDLSPYPLTGSASAPLGSGLLFAVRSSSDSTGGWEWTFWSSDGTPQGTRALFPLRFGGNPREFTAGGGLVYFYAQSAESPYPMQLWRTDGTEAGTYPLLSGTGSSAIPRVRLGGRTYFIAAQRPAGYELWSTDGTVAGTAPVVPSLTGERPSGPYHDRWAPTVFQGALWFFAQTSEDGQPWALWRSDGTAGGTRAVKILAAVADPATGHHVKPFEPAVLGDQLFFRQDDGVHGLELWKTDGTAAGTVLVKDVNPGPASSHIDHLTAAGGRLYFAATDGEHGYELWESDGTESGTRMVMDILPGFASSNPGQLTPAGDRLFFDADDGEHGLELWALPLP